MKRTRTLAFSNLAGAILFLCLGIWAFVQTLGFAQVKGTYVQPALFPQIMIAGLVIFSAALLVQSIVKLKTMSEGDPLAAPAATLNFLKDKGVLYALIVILLCAGFVALFKPLGYVICSAAVSFVIMVMIGKRSWVQMALVSVLVPLLMWFVFYKVLTVNIPMGPLKVLAELVDKI